MHPRLEQRAVVSYLAQVAAGLVPFVALAMTLDAYVAAEALVATVIVATVAVGNLLLCNRL
jgi:hypothetical protein